MRIRVRPARPLLAAAAVAALSAALIAGALPAQASTPPVAPTSPVAVAVDPTVPDATPGPTVEAPVVEAPADPTPAEPTPAEPTPAEPTSVEPSPAQTEEPAGVPAPVVLTPAEGDEQVGGATTFSGTGVAGARIFLYVFAEGYRDHPGDNADGLSYTADVGADGTWSTTQELPVGFWTVKADQSVGDDGTAMLGNVAFTIRPAAPTITAPTPAGHVDGRLHLAGTATAGSRVVLTIDGTYDEPLTLTAPVRANGTWSVDQVLPSGSYSVTAVESQYLPYERELRSIESGSSPAVSFTLSGARVAPVGHRTTLPMTGADPVPLIALTGSLLAAGLALVAVPAIRRRRAAGRSTPRG
ncbi:hypothetical protein ABID70_000806 [Clavibacter michiganensis]|uniref:hypothetical protein n=1 Tax=Clavibacter michiganensis TaxID=28447 RepID=UPI001AE9E2BE|nr:hypothetical protein [Clavibacter michiganensis]MBP2458248.1 hypothetical protein [Clavibacter michiganensis]MDQ0410819.1 hypothetical protein [Clavibacter michiganensis]